MSRAFEVLLIAATATTLGNAKSLGFGVNRIRLGVFAVSERSGGGKTLRSIAEHYQRLAMKIKAVIWQEDRVWCASVPALPGCHTWGENYEHLLEMLEDAIQGWLEVASE